MVQRRFDGYQIVLSGSRSCCCWRFCHSYRAFLP